MESIQLGVGWVALRLRHARSLKDKRNEVQSLVQRLRNLGFSVTELSSSEELKSARIGFCFVGKDTQSVAERFGRVGPLLLGYEVMGSHKDIITYEAPLLSEESLGEE